MDSNSNVSITSVKKSVQDSPITSLAAKIRRLKIQEDWLIQSIKKSMPVNYDSCENNFIKADVEYKKYEAGLKKTFGDIKLLLEDVRCTTKSQEMLKTLDIDDIKRDVLELDHKIKSFKTFLQNELTELKKSESDLIKQLEDNAKQNVKIIKRAKVTTKSYSDIIPSPVRTLINSPLKYPEVQKFQDFISNSSKYGGWNEYNHNIFIRIWQKHFGHLENDENFIESEIIDTIEIDCFIDEVIEKVSGVKRNDIISHMNWYSKYLYLKKRKQKAIDEWKEKTRPKKIHKLTDSRKNHKKLTKICSAHQNNRENLRENTTKSDGVQSKRDYFSDDSVVCSSTTDEDNFYSCVDANEFFKEMDHTHNRRWRSQSSSSSEFGFVKPTKQWINRCNHVDKGKTDLQAINRNIEDIRKLGVPSWRSGLAREV